MAGDDIVINLRTRGGRQAAGEVRGVSAAITQLGYSSSRAASRGFGSLTRNARYAGFAIGGLGAFAVKAGIQFNATMEQNEVAFTSFLGSTRAAREELQFLYKTAAVTPFQIGDITDASRKLLAFGFSAKQANSLLLTAGDAIAGAGLGPDAISMLIRDIGQIKGKGKLMAQELNQLGELGILNRADFAKNLGITTAELANAGEQGIPAAKAIRALQKTLDQNFGGDAAKQAKTFNGQISTLKDNLNIMLGTVTKPGFESLRTRVLPALGDSTTALNRIFGRKDLDLAEKVTLSRAVLKRKLGPVVSDTRDAISEMNLGPTISGAFERAVPLLADAAGRAAPKVGKAFWDAFWQAGPFGKLALGAGALKALGGGGLGGISGIRGPIGAGTPLNPIAVIGGVGGGIPGIGGKGLFRKVARSKALRTGLRGAGAGAAFGVFADALINPDRIAIDTRPGRGKHRVLTGGGQSIDIPNGYDWDPAKGLVPDRDPRTRIAKPMSEKRWAQAHKQPVELTAEGGRLILKTLEQQAADKKARR